jgi:DNA-directed RNA polymerase III subunit RPC6
MVLDKQFEDIASVVYTYIASSGRSGMWKKTVVQRSNVYENTVTKLLKELMASKLIKEFKTARNPTKRMYILYSLEPAEESVGGVFYEGGELEDALVNVLSDLVVDYVDRHSWVELPKAHPSRTKDARKKSKERQSSVLEENTKPYTAAANGQRFKIPIGRVNEGALVPYPPSFRDYPDAQAILDHINDGKVLKEQRTLNIEDMNQLIKTLILDDRLEEMSKGRYRSVRRVWKDGLDNIGAHTAPLVAPVNNESSGIGPGNGLTEMPCGRCPVSQDCRIGGKISPDNCVYMADWLSF